MVFDPETTRILLTGGAVLLAFILAMGLVLMALAWLLGLMISGRQGKPEIVENGLVIFDV